MRLRKALSISRIFWYKRKKYFAAAWLKRMPKPKFTVICSDYPNPDGYYELSSEILVKPVIRENARSQNDPKQTKPGGSITQNPQPDPSHSTVCRSRTSSCDE